MSLYGNPFGPQGREIENVGFGDRQRNEGFVSKNRLNQGSYTHCSGALGQQWPSEMTHHSRIVI